MFSTEVTKALIGKLLLALLLAGTTLFTSACRGNSEPDKHPCAIGFSHSSTKAGEDDIKNDGVKVHGLIDFNNGGSVLSIIDSRELTFSDGKWSYSPVSYWVPEKWHAFISWYPKTSGVLVSEDPTDGTTASVYYSVISNNAINRQEFLFWAGLYYSNETNRANRVPIALSHKLAMLSFNVNVSGFDQLSSVVIDDVVLTGMYTSGNYVYNIKGNDEPFEITESWSPSGTVYTGNVFHSGEKSLSHGMNTGVVSGLMMIPQSVSQAVNLKIDYHVTSGKGTNNYTKYLPLSSTSAQFWEAGARYNYSITFTPNAITFGDISVKDWYDDVHSIGLIIR